jgi:hypothetical protein
MDVMRKVRFEVTRKDAEMRKRALNQTHEHRNDVFSLFRLGICPVTPSVAEDAEADRLYTHPLCS